MFAMRTWSRVVPGVCPVPTLDCMACPARSGCEAAHFGPKDEKGIQCPMGYAVAAIDPKTMIATEIARGGSTPSFTGTASDPLGVTSVQLALRKTGGGSTTCTRIPSPSRTSMHGVASSTCRSPAAMSRAASSRASPAGSTMPGS